ncbi:MAG: N-acetyltransferase [Vicinamibacteria bacterium]
MARMPEKSVPLERIRPLKAEDLSEVVRIDGLHTGLRKRAYWSRVFERFLKRDGRAARIGLGVEAPKGLAGYLLGEVRAFEFGSEPCGWIFAVGVDPNSERRGVASLLLAEAVARFQAHGIPRIRTMVRRNDVPVLAFFRGNGFRGGPFVQLELNVEEVA